MRKIVRVLKFLNAQMFVLNLYGTQSLLHTYFCVSQTVFFITHGAVNGNK